MPTRVYRHRHPLNLDLGGTLTSVDIAYETYGTLNDNRDNAILVLHALTGDAHAYHDGTGTPGWWDGYIGPRKPFDTDRWFIVSPNVLGGCAGTTGPASSAPDGVPYGSRFPRISIRDQVHVEAFLADHLGIDRFALVAGGSMGGMRALEWCLLYPQRVAALWVGASSAFATAEQVALHTLQIQSILADANWCGGDYRVRQVSPDVGLGLARRLAHLSYRTEDELALRFARDVQPGEDPYAASTVADIGQPGFRFTVQSYLDHQATKLVARFDAGSYVALTDAMSTHDVGRGRGGVAAALRQITVPMVVTGVRSDRLFPLRLQQQIVDAVPTAKPLLVLDSLYGHDSFLLPDEELANHLLAAVHTIPVRR